MRLILLYWRFSSLVTSLTISGSTSYRDTLAPYSWLLNNPPNPSKAVLEAQGSVLTNKYAEGYPEKRYYGGCENIDEVEQAAIRRAKELFSAEHVNVQPYTCSVANIAAYMTLTNHGDTIMGMRLDQGGHLTHGSPVSFSGKFYHSIF